MNYKLVNIDEKVVSGLPVLLTDSQKENYQIIRNQWKLFNSRLRAIRRDRSSFWEKFGITIRKDNRVFYIPSMEIFEFNILDKFIIPEGSYLQFEHIGAMGELKKTIYLIYKNIIPFTDYKIDLKREFIHFEKYGPGFNWNKENSVIYILIPVALG